MANDIISTGNTKYNKNQVEPFKEIISTVSLSKGNTETIS